MTLKSVPCPMPSLSLKNEWSGNVRAISRLIMRSHAELVWKRSVYDFDDAEFIKRPLMNVGCHLQIA